MHPLSSLPRPLFSSRCGLLNYDWWLRLLRRLLNNGLGRLLSGCIVIHCILSIEDEENHNGCERDDCYYHCGERCARNTAALRMADLFRMNDLTSFVRRFHNYASSFSVFILICHLPCLLCSNRCVIELTSSGRPPSKLTKQPTFRHWLVH